MVHKYKMIISPDVFFSFRKYWFFRLLGGSKGKNWPQMTKNSIGRALHLRNYQSCDLNLCHTCVKGWHLQEFSTLIFGVVSRVKGQNIAQNDKKCLTPYLRKYTSYDTIWATIFFFLSDFFDIFSQFWFFRLLGHSGSKKWPKMTKNILVYLIYLRNHTSYPLHFWYACVK